MNIDDFLAEKTKQESRVGLDAFLSGAEESAILKPRSKAEQVNPLIKAPMEFGAGFNDYILNVLDIPNDAFNWAAEKLGADVRVPSTRDLGAQFGIGYKEGEEPDTGSYQAGEYTGIGLSFLAPILRAGAVSPTVANPSTARGVSQAITKPFVERPMMSYGGEIASSVLSGYGAHYGREKYGWKGEQAGAMIGGLAPQASALSLRLFESIPSAPKFSELLQRKLFPFTKPGAKQRAGQIIRSLSETGTPAKDMKLNQANILKDARISPARKTEDPDLMALEKVLINEDKVLAREFRLLDEKNNNLARGHLNDIKGNDSVQEAQLFLKGKYASLTNKLNAYLDIKVQKAQELVKDMGPKQARETYNKSIREAVDTALDASRKDEDTLWRNVPVDEQAETSGITTAFRDQLDARYKSDDPSEIPAYIYEFLGKYDNKGKYNPGKFGEIESVGEVHAFRSRLLKDIRREKKMEAPDYNKARIMNELQESTLNELEKTAASEEIKDAIAFSRQLNQRFKGGIMSTILGSDAHGGRLAPSLTMEGVGMGPKGAENIRRLLDAAPESSDNVEQVVRMEMLYKLVNKKTGRISNMNTAKRYQEHNSEMLDIFPETKKGLESAIALEEQATWYTKTVRDRMAKAQQSTAYKISKASPKRIITTILEAKEPAQAMRRELKRMNIKGHEGIKNDIINTLIKKSETDTVLNSGYKALSGDKMHNYWTENKSALGIPFSGKEIKRIQTVINTKRLSEGAKDLPLERAAKALEPTHGIMEVLVRILAARGASKSGVAGGSAGAGLQTAQIASSRAKKLIGDLDIGRAKKMLKDAILDEELYNAIAADATEFTPKSKHWRVIQGWMIANAVDTMQERKE